MPSFTDLFSASLKDSGATAKYVPPIPYTPFRPLPYTPLPGNSATFDNGAVVDAMAQPMSSHIPTTRIFNTGSTLEPPRHMPGQGDGRAHNTSAIPGQPQINGYDAETGEALFTNPNLDSNPTSRQRAEQARTNTTDVQEPEIDFSSIFDLNKPQKETESDDQKSPANRLINVIFWIFAIIFLINLFF